MQAFDHPFTGGRPDHYPSRSSLPAQFLPRRDPVIYAQNRASAPVPRVLLERYERDGFIVLESLFDAAEMAEFQREFTRLQQVPGDIPRETVITEKSGRDMRSVFAIHQSSPVFARLAADPRLVDLARFLLDDEVYIHQSRINYKPGFRGRDFYWHSDFETWHVEDGMPRMRAVSISITLTENRACNGPLMLIPGSHLKYVVCEGTTPEEHFRTSLKEQEVGVPCDRLLETLVAERDIQVASTSPGSAIVFDCNTMHGSFSNITPHPRANAFFVYNAVSNSVGAPFCERPPRPWYIRAVPPVTAGAAEHRTEEDH
ncbi:MAG: phytanoyl-CoA dioxygenase family protein [Halioglobus sp.]